MIVANLNCLSRSNIHYLGCQRFMWLCTVSSVIIWRRNLVAKSEAKDGGNWRSYWRTLQSSYLRGQIFFLLFWPGVMSREPWIFLVFLIVKDFKRERMEIKLIYFVRICFSVSTRYIKPLYCCVSKYEFFAVNSAPAFQTFAQLAFG